jgi:signal transduction histidine kinase
MGTLIDNLLTYAKARDARLRAAPTDLRSLVDDVIASHADRPLSAGMAPPQIYVGPLPTVHADPVLLRHLINNLIGNAMKYTRPGQPARVEITAHTNGPDWIRIDVADRGIGIPAGQHTAVFESFHRANPAAGYTGTGLGLAICRRIVERHGGTITATDNPGGGTRFQVTLPSATDPTRLQHRHPILSQC